MADDWGSIALATRHGSSVHPAFVQCWAAMLFGGTREGDMLLNPAIRFHAHKGANTIIEWFFADPDYKHCDTICFVDDDHVFPHDTLERLRSNKAGWEFDVLGGLHTVRRDDALLVLGLPKQYHDAEPYDDFRVAPLAGWNPGEVVPVEGIGLGFTLIRRHVFERVEAKYPGEQFQFSHEWPTSNDLIWSRKVRRSGSTIGVDTGVRIGHLVFDATKWPTPEANNAG